ncbi:hypothetical protein LTR20_007314 [Exophiala xenobiotica]|nr:hypothetical protein LTR92_007217 [Exophiala xenobiotica]KAK5371079.1 hypothetical protein LTS13_006456 [Exophiala xenobiotica]KAK5401176.1 hypothetical protein LTR79_001695 [Exophiala xenobiotica]KAK5409103.1 hypothetical protein LTR90_009226 [Exophiala xenobiotica]KAK5440766.1 hypothetical protein LTR18_007370 [Exophiala xenobiotica]
MPSPERAVASQDQPPSDSISPKATPDPIQQHSEPAIKQDIGGSNDTSTVDLEKGKTTPAQDSASAEQLDDHQKQETQPPTNQNHDVGADKPYSAFTQRQKILIVLCATLGGLFSPFTTNIYFPALSTIADDLSVSISQVNLTITTYMIFQAIAPAFVSSITDTQGRRPTYVLGMVVFMAANLGLALNNTYAGLLVLRCLQSCGSSGMVTLQQAIIADVVTSAERGSYIGITSITSIVGPSVAPVAGGLLAQHLGWHSIFWFLLIMAAVYAVPLLIWFPETARKLVGDGLIIPPRLNRSLWYIVANRKNDKPGEASSPKPKRKFSWPNPLGTLAVFTDFENTIVLSVVGIIYAAFYAISATLSTQFNEIYGLDSASQGLVFLTIAGGSLLSSVTNSIALDRNYRRHALKHGLDPGRKKQIDLQGFPIERARLEIGLPFFVLGALTMIVYGWMLHFRVHMAGPIVMLVLFGYTNLAGFNTLSVLLIDLNRPRAAAASAAANLVRASLGAGMTGVVNPMIKGMGTGWCFTFTGLVQLCMLPLLWLCMEHGVRWRRQKLVAGTSREN